MPAERPAHRVSCKVALYSPMGDQVLVMHYPDLGPDAHGLPGGHLEKRSNAQGEPGKMPDDPEATVLRELLEEVGHVAIVGAVKRADFWVQPDTEAAEDGKIVLAFTGQAADTHLLPPEEWPNGEFEQPRWVLVDDVASGAVNVGMYQEFIVNNRPITV